jgi:hypothetical protein
MILGRYKFNVTIYKSFDTGVGFIVYFGKSKCDLNRYWIDIVVIKWAAQLSLCIRKRNK